MTEKQINKWLRRQFAPIGWVLLGYLGLINLLVSFAMVLDILRQVLWNRATGGFLLDLDLDALYQNGWGYLASVFVVLLVLPAWKGGGYWSRILRHKEGKMRFLPFFTCLSICIGAPILNSLWISGLEVIMNQLGRSVLPLLEEVSGATDSVSMLLYSAVGAPIAEELLFRGFALETLRPYGKRFAICGSALLFGMFHGNLLQAPYALVMGLVLGYLTVEYSFLWALLLHVFNNFVLAEGLGRLTQLLPPMTAELLTVCLTGAFLLISLGILIANRKIIRRYCQEQWIDRRCVKCLLTTPSILLLLTIQLWMMGSIFFL